MAATGLRLIVFAKAPQPGRAKTRLVPALGVHGAAALAERLLDHAVHQASLAVQAWPGTLELCAAPDATHRVFRRLAVEHGLTLTEQGEGDIGHRMHRALARALAEQGSEGALLMGSDLPSLTAARLLLAAEALLSHDAVFVPALDGGYGLVGLKRPAPALFDGVAWSTPQVLAQTRAKARKAGLSVAVLDPIADIDEPADLVHLPAGWAAATPRS
jgi:rSAM/selenodomain-associated transferase 1